MSPTVILIRHAEAEHNFAIHDPGLTELGKEQCRELAKFLENEVPLAKDIDLIVTSPLTRTLQTTDIALGWLIKSKNVPVLLKPEWQETTDKPCDKGRPVADVKDDWPQFDFSTVLSDKYYPSKEGPYVYTQDALMARIAKCLKFLQRRNEKVVCVVSHSGFMRRLSRRKYGNADFRVFEFNEDNEFVERDIGKAKNGTGGRGLSPSDPSRPKEHWAGIKKSLSITDLSSFTRGSTPTGTGHGSCHLEVPHMPERPSSR
ncbi:hypothetical protein MKZ38_009308 [Zalerion maritima]|uniref:Phosphoglycerate mutase n=1 Tax=Zalerion maritima TaxID=339359 RepID=A0AAD5RV77_9PEZI|nr:hypothetical protein MKZ38_009308 [Zalerion maritima]